MAPAGLILTVALKVFSMTDTSLIVRNATGDCGFSVVQCTTTPEGLEGAIKMEVIEPKEGSVSSYDVHLRYEPNTGLPKYFKVDNMTNKVYLDNERSTRPQFRAEGMPVANGKHAFVFTKIDPTATKKLQMKVKLSDEHSIDCPSKEDGATSANAERITDSQELVMLSMNGGLNTHRHILGHLIEC